VLLPSQAFACRLEAVVVCTTEVFKPNFCPDTVEKFSSSDLTVGRHYMRKTQAGKRGCRPVVFIRFDLVHFTGTLFQDNIAEDSDVSGSGQV